jgi:hypothetical protein
MRNLLPALLVGMSVMAGAAVPTPPLSAYSEGLRLVSSDDYDYKFEGLVTLRGTLFIHFDMAAPDRAGGEVNFARFAPDAQSVKLLPAVVGGKFPAPIRYINLEPPGVAFEAAFGKVRAAELAYGSAPIVQTEVVVTLRNFGAEVACDSRVYFATIELSDVKPSNVEPPLSSAPAHGC